MILEKTMFQRFRSNRSSQRARPCAGALATTALASIFLATSLPAQVVKSTTGSIQNIAAQRERNKANPQVARALQSYSCLKMQPVAAPPTRMVIPHHYLVGSSGAINPAEVEVGKFYKAFESRVAAGANQWLTNGNNAEAACALDQMDLWAQARSLLTYDIATSPQSWYQVEWTLSALGIANSVLVNNTSLDLAKQKRVNQWLGDVARTMMRSDRAHGNNHHYWRGLAAISVGVSTGDDKLFRQGINAYKDGVEEVDSRGAFPQEMDRSENAIHYQEFALEPLILIAEFAEQQGIDLYSYAVHGRTLRDAVLFLSHAVDDPSVVLPYTKSKQKQNFTPRSFPSEAFFVARFGGEGLSSLMTGDGTLTAWQSRLGGTPAVFLAGACRSNSDLCPAKP